MKIAVELESLTDLTWRAKCGEFYGKPARTVPSALENLAHGLRELANDRIVETLEAYNATNASRL